MVNKAAVAFSILGVGGAVALFLVKSAKPSPPPGPGENSLTIDVVGSGTTTPGAGSHNYTTGSIVQLSAVPAAGWTFTAWQEGATVLSTNPDYSLTLSGNRSVVAIFEQPLPFSFSNVSATRVTLNAAPAFSTMNFSCTITNPNSVPITKTLLVRYKYYDSYHNLWYDMGAPYIFDQMLNPGQSYTFYWDGNGRIFPSMSMQQIGHMWLEDEAGNKSPEGVA